MKKQSQKLLALFLAVALALPLGMLASLGVYAEAGNETTVEAEAEEKVQYTEPTVTSSAVTTFSFTNASYSAIDKAWAVVANGGTIIIPVKGWVSDNVSLPAASSPVLITARNTDGKLYFNPDNPAVDGNQAGMIMIAAYKTLTFNSDVIFDDIVILQRSCNNEATAANIKISNNSTMVIGENTQFLYSKTSNPAVCNSRLTVDYGSTLVLKAGGALSYSGEGTIFVDSKLFGNGIDISQFASFYGEMYDLDGSRLVICDHAGHRMGARLVDGAFVEACMNCGYTENKEFSYTVPTLTNTSSVYWAHSNATFTNVIGTNTALTFKTSGISTSNDLPDNVGTFYVVQKGYVNLSHTFSFSAPVRFTAVLDDNFAEIAGYTGDTALNLDLREKDLTGAAQPQFGAILTYAGCTLRFASDVIFDKVNFYCRDANPPTFEIANGATAVFTDVTGMTNNSKRPVIRVASGATAIFLGDNVKGFNSITGNGTVVIDMELFRNGSFNASYFADFDGTVLTTDCKQVCALTGNHNVTGGVCTDCGWEDGATYKVYVKHGGTGDGSSPDSPTNSIRPAFAAKTDVAKEIILVDDVIVGSAIECVGSEQDITIKSIDVDGDGVYPKLIIRSWIVFLNSAASSTIKFENIEIQSDRSGTVPLFFCYNNVEIGEGVTCTLSGNYEDGGYPIIYGGYLPIQSTPSDTPENRSNDRDTTITVKSGTWSSVIAGNRRLNQSYAMGINKGKMTVNIEGGTFLGDSSNIAISGSGHNFTWGDIDVNISGGNVYGDVYGIITNGQYGGNAPYGDYGYKSNVDISITGGSLGGNIYAKYNNITIPALLRGNVNVHIGADVTLTSSITVDMLGTVPYANETKVAALTYADVHEGTVTARFADYINGTKTNAVEPKRLAFIGDSITEGTCSSDDALFSYPAQLQSKLDSDEYLVGNFGIGASGVLPSTVYYYNDSLQYKLLLEEFDPAIVSFALGTNDAVACGGTKGVADDFESRYYSLIESVCKLDSVDKVYVATPLLRLDNTTTQARNASVVEPAIRRTVARLTKNGYNAILFELNANTYERVLAGEVLCADNLHPHDAGYGVMADAFYNAIFNGVVGVPDGYYVDTFYASTAGTLTGKGTADDPSTHYEVGLSRLNKSGATLVFIDSYTIYGDVSTPTDMTGSLIIKGNTPEAKLTWTGNTFKLGGDMEIDDINLITTSNVPTIICWFNSITIGESFTNTSSGSHDIVLVAGYLTYENRDNPGAVDTKTYDTAESASSSRDVSIVIKNGTFGAVVLGNRRMSDKALFGTYSGNMTAQLLGGIITGNCDSGYVSSAMAMMNLAGNIDVSIDGMAMADGVTFYGASRTASKAGVTYDASLNTGKVSISAAASVIEKKTALSEKAATDSQYAHLANLELIYTTDRGDMNEDGELTNADITLLIRVLSGWTDVPYADYSADITANGKLNNRDAICLIKKVAAWTEE